MAASLPPVCTMRGMHIPTQRSPDFHSLAICSGSSKTDGRSWKNSKSNSPPWSGLLSTTCGNEHQSAYLEQKEQGLRSPFCFEFLSCGVDPASCCSSSTSWGSPSATHVVGPGCLRTRTDGLAHKLCELVMVAGYTHMNGSNVGKARSRRQRRKRFTNCILKAWQFSYEVAVLAYEGGHPSLSGNRGSTYGHILLQTLVETSGGTKPRGLRLVPTDVQQYRSSRHICCCSSDDDSETKLDDPVSEEKDVNNLGVEMALALLRFYKREMSPYIPASCRYVPTCSVYAQQAYRKYGFVKGSILTAWRLARCNPLGSSGFDPPRWFGEERPPQV